MLEKGFLQTEPALPWKPSVRVATTSDLTLSGTQTIDGVAVIAGDLVCATGQGGGAAPTTHVSNGPWIVAAGAWVRPDWFDTGSDLTQSAIFKVLQGNNFANRVLQLATAPPITVGTTAISMDFVADDAPDNGFSQAQTPPASGAEVTVPASGGPAYHRHVYGTITLTATAIAAAKITIAVEDAVGSGVFDPIMEPQVGAGLTSAIALPYSFDVEAGRKYKFTKGGALGVAETITHYNYHEV